jgi:hypothetical protein
MARILLHNDTNTNTNPNAGIVLLSYRSCILLPYESDKPRADTHTDQQASHCTALRTNKPRYRYAYETTLITRYADTPTTQ